MVIFHGYVSHNQMVYDDKPLAIRGLFHVQTNLQHGDPIVEKNSNIFFLHIDRTKKLPALNQLS